MSERRITGRHVLYGLLTFFGVILAANAVFIYLALDTFTGLSTENAYQRGVEYNKTLESRAEQRELGWRAAITFDETGGGAGVLRAALSNRAGMPIEDLRVTGQVRRPTHAGNDQELVLTRSGDGVYSAELTLPGRGQWDVYLVAESRDGTRFEMEQRLWLK